MTLKDQAAKITHLVLGTIGLVMNRYYVCSLVVSPSSLELCHEEIYELVLVSILLSIGTF